MSRGQQVYAWVLAIVAIALTVVSGAFQSVADLVFPAALAITLSVCLALGHREPSTRSRLTIAAVVSGSIGIGSLYFTGNPLEALLTTVASALAMALLPPSLAAYRKNANAQR